MTDPAPRLAPRSVGAVADFELLRVARTEFDEPEGGGSLSLADRIRDLAPFRALRASGEGLDAVVRLDRTDA